MTREEKVQLVSDLTEKFKETDHFYITDVSGLTVAEVNKFREMCFRKDVEYKMVKNTLIRKVLENIEGDFSPLNKVLKGTSGIMFVNENANAPARIIKDFRKEVPKERPAFKAASIDSDLFIGEVITLLQSPAKNVLSLLQSGEQKLAGIVKRLSEREE